MDKYDWLCRKFAMFGEAGCNRGSSCPRGHKVPTAAQKQEMLDAYNALQASRIPPVLDSPRSSGGGSVAPRGAGVRWCSTWHNGGGCTHGDRCVFRHADTEADLARCKAEIQRRDNANGNPQPSASATRVYSSGALRRWQPKASPTEGQNDAWAAWNGPTGPQAFLDMGH